MEQLLLFEEDLDNQGLFVLEEAVRPSNLLKAYKRVKRNDGAPGPDGMTIKELGLFLTSNMEKLRTSLLSGSYQPQPVRKKEISKPGGGKRKLGIPSLQLNPATWGKILRAEDPAVNSRTARTADLVSILEAFGPIQRDRQVLFRGAKRDT